MRQSDTAMMAALWLLLVAGAVRTCVLGRRLLSAYLSSPPSLCPPSSPGHPERPLRLLLVGHNPSDHAWKSGHYYRWVEPTLVSGVIPRQRGKELKEAFDWVADWLRGGGASSCWCWWGSNPSNRMWRLLTSTGIVLPHFTAQNDDDCPHVCGVGFTDLVGVVGGWLLAGTGGGGGRAAVEGASS